MAAFEPGWLERDALEVAPDLLGMLLTMGPIVLRITEVEAYRYPDDTACHAHRGPTPRNQVMFGRAGIAYVYRVYGLHHLLNVVTGRPGEGAAVLIRACEPVHGESEIARRRGGAQGTALLAGPGRVGAALGLDVSWSGHDLLTPGGLELRPGVPPRGVRVGPRVGIDYAAPTDRVAPWRFADADSRWVSRPAGLRPRGD